MDTKEAVDTKKSSRLQRLVHLQSMSMLNTWKTRVAKAHEQLHHKGTLYHQLISTLNGQPTQTSNYQPSRLKMRL